MLCWSLLLETLTAQGQIHSKITVKMGPRSWQKEELNRHWRSFSSVVEGKKRLVLVLELVRESGRGGGNIGRGRTAEAIEELTCLEEATPAGYLPKLKESKLASVFMKLEISSPGSRPPAWGIYQLQPAPNKVSSAYPFLPIRWILTPLNARGPVVVFT